MGVSYFSPCPWNLKVLSDLPSSCSSSQPARRHRLAAAYMINYAGLMKTSSLHWRRNYPNHFYTPLPPASACYPPSAPSGNCSSVIANYTNGNWRSDQPGSMQNTNFETFIFPNDTISACYLNTTLGFPCGQGSVPPVGVCEWCSNRNQFCKTT